MGHMTMTTPLSWAVIRRPRLATMDETCYNKHMH